MLSTRGLQEPCRTMLPQPPLVTGAGNAPCAQHRPPAPPAQLLSRRVTADVPPNGMVGGGLWSFSHKSLLPCLFTPSYKLNASVETRGQTLTPL